MKNDQIVFNFLKTSDQIEDQNCNYFFFCLILDFRFFDQLEKVEQVFFLFSFTSY